MAGMTQEQVQTYISNYNRAQRVHPNANDYNKRGVETVCPHCKGKTFTGTRGGCLNCGRVKHTSNGRIARRA